MCASGLASLAGCWTTAPPTPTTTQPAQTADITRRAPPTRWKKSPTRSAPVDTMQTARVDPARELTDQLRRSGGQLLPSFVAGPIVVLDIDAGTVSTVCDQPAVTGAQRWGQMFADRARPPVACRGGATMMCSQFSPTTILVVQLADPDAWRIVSVVVGNHRKNRTAMHTNMAALRAQIATATCP